ncbi:SDR family NAD(P)-dependent oxidoreductase [Alkalicoccus halolimnae]|uniref:Glucose 1-dehydrogenase n=1 Tax=Alkalicoccus halolimnae TaxID=1667239 RepID=A0A5C7FM86_9BACI|nr:glucose 1-dehydrogenase [Alkalicoccus halolimnae]TXF87504.1 glucose 1-dehydrogenase [Alkalicoccus halolimnae]
MKKLEGQISVITGGAGNLGSTAAELFLKEGSKVAIVDKDPEQLKLELNRLGKFGDIISIQADVTSEKDVRDYVDQVLSTWGRIDVFLNNAGILGKVAPLIDQETEDFEAIMNINVKGVFLGLKYVLPIMIDHKKGSIINTSSTSGLTGSSGNSLYSASKHAVVGLTKTAALESAPSGIRVNSIHPSPIDSEMMRIIAKELNKDDPEKIKEKITARIPLGRYGAMQEVANLMLFLAGDDSKFITGSQYRVDGGMGAR